MRNAFIGLCLSLVISIVAVNSTIDHYGHKLEKLEHSQRLKYKQFLHMLGRGQIKHNRWGKCRNYERRNNIQVRQFKCPLNHESDVHCCGDYSYQYCCNSTDLIKDNKRISYAPYGTKARKVPVKYRSDYRKMMEYLGNRNISQNTMYNKNKCRNYERRGNKYIGYFSCSQLPFVSRENKYCCGKFNSYQYCCSKYDFDHQVTYEPYGKNAKKVPAKYRQNYRKMMNDLAEHKLNGTHLSNKGYCKNYEKRGKRYIGYFKCPLNNEENRYCCGKASYQYCCAKPDYVDANHRTSYEPYGKNAKKVPWRYRSDYRKMMKLLGDRNITINTRYTKGYCRNYERRGNKYIGYFKCPLLSGARDRSFRYCCGKSSYQYCCNYRDHRKESNKPSYEPYGRNAIKLPTKYRYEYRRMMRRLANGSIRQQHRYKKDHCQNQERRGKKYIGYFTCPQSTFYSKRDNRYCCGKRYYQYCCDYGDSLKEANKTSYEPYGKNAINLPYKQGKVYRFYMSLLAARKISGSKKYVKGYCKNFEMRGYKSLGYFRCPLFPVEDKSHTYCCGKSSYQFCCGYNDYQKQHGYIGHNQPHLIIDPLQQPVAPMVYNWQSNYSWSRMERMKFGLMAVTSLSFVMLAIACMIYLCKQTFCKQSKPKTSFIIHAAGEFGHNKQEKKPIVQICEKEIEGKSPPEYDALKKLPVEENVKDGDEKMLNVTC